MKTKVLLLCAATLIGSSLASAGERAVILTTHVPVNDALTLPWDPARLLYITDDSNYADRQWHRVPGLQHTVMRTIMVSKNGGPLFITQTRRVSSVSQYPAEREPKLVWSRAFYKYRPYPVDYTLLKPEPEREHVGYTTIERVDPPSQPEPFTPLPPIAEGPTKPVAVTTQ